MLDLVLLDHIIVTPAGDWSSMRSEQLLCGHTLLSEWLTWWGDRQRERGRVRPHCTDGRKRVGPKYRDSRTGETWAGRGSRPRWLRRYLEQGREVEEFRIQPGTVLPEPWEAQRWAPAPERRQVLRELAHRGEPDDTPA